MTDAEELMDFLASPEAMELPDQIEEVNAKQLDKLVQEKMFVAVFFCKFSSRNTSRTQKTAHIIISRNTKIFLKLGSAICNCMPKQTLPIKFNRMPT